ncbi:MAG: ShlB/FhaC/HecB family hemolysin secretion/activation protein [Myxococcota bacterium]
MRRALSAAGLIVFSILTSADAWGQQPRPADSLQLDREELATPSLDSSTEKPLSLELPPLVERPEPAPFESAEGFVVRGFRIVGATVFDDAELSAVLSPFLGRPLQSEDLPALTDAITGLYIEAGYLSSGARIPDQSAVDGIIEVHVVEGTLPRIRVEGGGRLAPFYVEDRVTRGLSAPFNLEALERNLRLLQIDPRIDRVDAVILPGVESGASVLQLNILEANPWELDFRVANDLSPALGESRASATLRNRNVLGFGDQFSGVVSGARGLLDFDLAYSIPFTPWLTEFEIRGGLSQSEVVEGAFANQFENEIQSYGVALTQPLLLTLENEIRGRVEFERRTSLLSFDDGQNFDLETAPGDDETIRLSMLRLTLDWIHRETDRVFAAQLLTTMGLDVWDATTTNNTAGLGGPALPDAEFTSWLLQFQYAQRIDTRIGAAELIARGDLQVATGAVFSLESFAMGGASTVRGYRENSVVSDNGALGSVEFRIPVFPDQWGPHEMRLAPFVDMGYAWDDSDRVAKHFERLFVSLGFGVLYRYSDRFELNAYWGRGLRYKRLGRDGDTQRHGFHLEARLAVF